MMIAEPMSSLKRPPTSPPLRALSLFSGIGGFELAAERVGVFDVKQMVEIDPDARAILGEHFPDIPIHGDIKTFKGEPGQFDVIWGGFPCTNTSVAGDKTGLKGDKSFLWFEMLRIIKEVNPKFIVIENVRGLVNRGLRAVLGGLRMAGYCWDDPQIVSAAELGAPHQRDRLFIVAYSNQQLFREIPTRWSEQTRDMVQAVRAAGSWPAFERGNDGITVGLPGGLDEDFIGTAKGTPGRIRSRYVLGRTVTPAQAEIALRRVQYLNDLCVVEQEKEEKMLPNKLIENIEAEEAILGGILLDPDAIAMVASLPAEAFFVSKHQTIFQIALELYNKGRPTDLITVATELADRKRLEEIGGQSKLAQLVDRTVTAVNIDQYAELVRDKWLRRSYVSVANEIAEAAQDGSQDLTELTKRSQGLLNSLADAPGIREIEQAKQTCLRWLESPAAVAEDSVKEAFVKAESFLLIDRGDRLKLELLLWRSESDPERQAVLKSDICRGYKLNHWEWEKLVEGKGEVKEELESHLSSKNARISIEDILPIPLAKPLNILAENQSLRPECFLTALLCAVAGLQKADTRLLVKEALDWTDLSPNLFGGIVAESSQRKSPILRSIVSKPLAALDREAKEEFEQAEREWQRLEERYLCLDKAERKAEFPEGLPEKPERKTYYFTDTTGEGFRNQIVRQQGKGMTWIADELAGIFKSENQYRKGKGSDREDLLSYYDGTGKRTLRASGIVAEFDRVALSVIGGIQPKVLEELALGFDDSNGSWARFLFIQQPISPLQRWPEGKIDLQPMLEAIYSQIAQFPAKTYKFSPESDCYFGRQYLEAEKRRQTTASPAIRFAIGKLPGKMAKLALNLHVLKSAIAGESVPPDEIPLGTVKAAKKLADFYQSQLEAIATELGVGLAPELGKVIELSQRKGELSVRDVQNSYGSKYRPKADKVREMFNDLAKMGYGHIQQSKFVASQFPPNAHRAQSASDRSQRAQEPGPQPQTHAGGLRAHAPAAKTPAPPTSQPVAGVAGEPAHRAQSASDRPQCAQEAGPQPQTNMQPAVQRSVSLTSNARNARNQAESVADRGFDSPADSPAGSPATASNPETEPQAAPGETQLTDRLVAHRAQNYDPQPQERLERPAIAGSSPQPRENFPQTSNPEIRSQSEQRPAIADNIPDDARANIDRAFSDERADQPEQQPAIAQQPKKFISFGWTDDELLEGKKTVTRRAWPGQYARTFRKGDLIAATDKSPTKGGEAIALIRLTENPYKENLADLTKEEVEAEGFPNLTPEEFRNRFFKGKLQDVWVLRFEVVEILKPQEQPQEKNKSPFPAIGDWIVRQAHGAYQKMRCKVIQSNGEEAIAISEGNNHRWNFTKYSWEEGLFSPV